MVKKPTGGKTGGRLVSTIFLGVAVLFEKGGQIPVFLKPAITFRLKIPALKACSYIWINLFFCSGAIIFILAKNLVF